MTHQQILNDKNKGTRTGRSFLGNPTGRLKLPDKQIHGLNSRLIRMVCEGKGEVE